MTHKAQHNIMNDDVFSLSAEGRHQLSNKASILPKHYLTLLTLLGKESMTTERLIGLSPALKPDVAISCLQQLWAADMIVLEQASDSLDFTAFLSNDPVAQPHPHALLAAHEEAAVGTDSLKTQGYYVSIVRDPGPRRRLRPGERPTVVVIEDEHSMSMLLTKFLEIKGFDTIPAANREQIVAAFRRPAPPDLVLLDIVLPDADGFDILVTIRNHPALKSVPVIMLTAQATREAVIRGLACGADGYITKPFELDKLLSAVNTVIGLPSAIQHVAAPRRAAHYTVHPHGARSH
ncbi:MAG TPA: response regulator [Rhodocyclaceae bacterium]|nr:response regulator [Rhodocyclaceae bacterium]